MDQAQESSDGRKLSDGQEEGFPGRQKATVSVELTARAVSETSKLSTSTEPPKTMVATKLPAGASSKTCSPSEYRADVMGFLDLPGGTSISFACDIANDFGYRNAQQDLQLHRPIHL